jgi:cytochrome c-type biogenesis protein CcmH
MRRLLILLTCFLLLPLGALAIETEKLDDPELQARFEKITNELRCLVCQNQTIADSNAELAQDLRGQTRRMLLEGSTDTEVRDYMTQRYGDFVLYRPPLTGRTFVLWSAPVLLLLGGALVMIMIIRRRSLASDIPEVGEEPLPGLDDEDRR